MQLSGKIVEILPMVSGQGNSGEWRRQDVIVETGDRYPKKVCVGIWGSLIDSVPLTVGLNVDMQIDIESREYNEKWYTNVKAYRIESFPVQNSNIEPEDHSTEMGRVDDDEELPF